MRSDLHRPNPEGDPAEDERKALDQNALPEMALDASSATPVVEPEPPDADPLALSWVTDKVALGHRFSVGGNRLRITKWSALTDADRAFIREHRAAIKLLVRTGRIPDVDARPVTPAAPVAPAPPPIDLDAVGIETYERPNGSIGYTHSLGDDYAEDVMSGAIPLEVALRNERRTAQNRAGFFGTSAITVYTLVRK